MSGLKPIKQRNNNFKFNPFEAKNKVISSNNVNDINNKGMNKYFRSDYININNTNNTNTNNTNTNIHGKQIKEDKVLTFEESIIANKRPCANCDQSGNIINNKPTKQYLNYLK
tara:strand:+ start:831 stop:1169 length:339 start_codon:yes stop_codon:yes gene_type:complete